MAESGGRPVKGEHAVRTDVRPEPVVDEDEPARFNGRRLVRIVTILAVGILVVLAAWQDPVHANLP